MESRESILVGKKAASIRKQIREHSQTCGQLRRVFWVFADWDYQAQNTKIDIDLEKKNNNKKQIYKGCFPFDSSPVGYPQKTRSYAWSFCMSEWGWGKQ